MVSRPHDTLFCVRTACRTIRTGIVYNHPIRRVRQKWTVVVANSENKDRHLLLFAAPDRPQGSAESHNMASSPSLNCRLLLARITSVAEYQISYP